LASINTSGTARAPRLHRRQLRRLLERDGLAVADDGDDGSDDAE
jgi:hypothetical protein